MTTPLIVESTISDSLTVKQAKDCWAISFQSSPNPQIMFPTINAEIAFLDMVLITKCIEFNEQGLPVLETKWVSLNKLCSEEFKNTDMTPIIKHLESMKACYEVTIENLKKSKK